MFGEWQTSAAEYARDVKRYESEIGKLEWCAPQDWMCEPEMKLKTGLSTREHQIRTVASVVELRALGLPVIPVLQGWARGDYFDCWDLYERAGINLLREPVVGLGSVCRRQSSLSISFLINELADEGLRLHGFGVKTQGLEFSQSRLVSADSMAWSLAARRDTERGECGRKSCSSCFHAAVEWRQNMLSKLGASVLPARYNQQMSLF